MTLSPEQAQLVAESLRLEAGQHRLIAGPSSIMTALLERVADALEAGETITTRKETTQ